DDGSIVAVFGGFVNRSSTSDHSIYFLDTHTWIWTSTTANSVRGRSYSACAFSNNQFIVWGGFYQNPTSIPNNLPSIEESTLVYSLAAQNWVKTFVPSTESSSSGSASGGSGERTNGNNELSNGTRSIGIVLAIAAVGAILALLITIGALMVIRRRNLRRRGSNSSSSAGGGAGFNPSRRNSTQLSNHLASTGGGVTASNMMAPALNKTHFGTWDQPPRASNLESGLVKDEKKGGLVDNHDMNIPAVTG
ncbi:hypothetical protein BGZ70_003997, partial [Mortierella alpina]